MAAQSKDKSPEHRTVVNITGWSVLAWALGFGTFAITCMMVVVVQDHVTDWDTHNHHRHPEPGIWIPGKDTLNIFSPGFDTDTLQTLHPKRADAGRSPMLGSLGSLVKLPPSVRMVNNDTLTLKQRTLINWRWIQWYHGR